MIELKDVRIIELFPATVASVQFYCDEPERACKEVMDDFVIKNNLGEVNPDLRHYGFNNPNPSPEIPEDQPDHGYEMWVTVPGDMEIPAPLEKKYFTGGMYAAHMIKMGDFHEWGWLWDWVQKSDKYDYDCREPYPMGGCLEEHIDYLKNLKNPDFKEEDMQLDLLIPVTLK